MCVCSLFDTAYKQRFLAISKEKQQPMGDALAIAAESGNANGNAPQSLFVKYDMRRMIGMLLLEKLYGREEGERLFKVKLAAIVKTRTRATLFMCVVCTFGLLGILGTLDVGSGYLVFFNIYIPFLCAYLAMWSEVDIAYACVRRFEFWLYIVAGTLNAYAISDALGWEIRSVGVWYESDLFFLSMNAHLKKKKKKTRFALIGPCKCVCFSMPSHD